MIVSPYDLLYLGYVSPQVGTVFDSPLLLSLLPPSLGVKPRLLVWGWVRNNLLWWVLPWVLLILFCRLFSPVLPLSWGSHCLDLFVVVWGWSGALTSRNSLWLFSPLPSLCRLAPVLWLLLDWWLSPSPEKIRRDPKGSEGIRRDPKGSEGIRRDPKGSEGIRMDPKGSEGILDS